MMIEQNTNYAYKLKYMDNPTFGKVRDLSTKFYRELPQALQDELFEALNRGIDILDSEPQMTAYLFAFGKMHQAKLNYAFGKLPKEFLEQPEINIIDYGCGQALGTMCYADFLRENGYMQKAKTIALIEPSEICLKRRPSSQISRRRLLLRSKQVTQNALSSTRYKWPTSTCS